MRKKTFNYIKWKLAQTAPPPPMMPAAPPPPAPGAVADPNAPKSGALRASDLNKPSHVEELNKLFQYYLGIVDNDVKLAIAMACQRDGRGVIPDSVDVALTGKGAPYVRGIKGIDLGPEVFAPTGGAPPLPPPPM